MSLQEISQSTPSVISPPIKKNKRSYHVKQYTPQLQTESPMCTILNLPELTTDNDNYGSMGHIPIQNRYRNSAERAIQKLQSSSKLTQKIKSTKLRKKEQVPIKKITFVVLHGDIEEDRDKFDQYFTQMRVMSLKKTIDIEGYLKLKVVSMD